MTHMASLDRYCSHPGSFGNMCFVCGKTLEETGVSLGYIHKVLRLNRDEINRMCKSDMTMMESHRKLYLVLDLDHTLLNSTGINDMTRDEDYLKTLTQDNSILLFTVKSMGMMTKLRPFVRTFLKEANDMFEMYIYTMGDRRYARAMAKLLDPKGIYFSDRIISRDDCTLRDKKSLDVVLGDEEAVVIVDDSKNVWPKKHQGNLIEIERYHFFASSCKQFTQDFNSLSEIKMDESESDGPLHTVLNVLKQTHRLYFQNTSRDVRSVLKQVQHKTGGH
ncbi:RNA polymerase II C-terminal domain phosphatase-like 4 [Cardamine amara subsp. amara]|uniref:RNA polymerase II C-terminal domain phosphatase-like n=1 Tax=Cardamine amara subsp. amara TaxID=228776 RepID=A0ABD1BYG1_CARAN